MGRDGCDIIETKEANIDLKKEIENYIFFGVF
jgi:hypothetical protein